MPNILAFDTATDALTVALLKNSDLTHHFAIAPQQHAELILSVIGNLLAQAQLTLADLDAIAFGRGPGSFMGVRIAAGIAQGLAFGANLPVIPVSTLQALAQTAHELYQEHQVIAGWDARLNEIYWASYQADQQGIMQLLGEEQLSKPAELVLPKNAQGCLAGNAWQNYQQQLSSNFFDAFHSVRSELYPQASAIVKIAEVKLSRGEVVSAAEAQPVYVRDKVVG